MTTLARKKKTNRLTHKEATKIKETLEMAGDKTSKYHRDVVDRLNRTKQV